MGFLYEHKCAVEFEDMDQDGFVHHHKVACYFERAVFHAYKQQLGVLIREQDYLIVLSTLFLRCIVPISEKHKPIVYLTIKSLGMVSIIWEAKIVSEGESRILAQAEFKHGCINPVTSRPCKWPERISKRLSSYELET